MWLDCVVVSRDLVDATSLHCYKLCVSSGIVGRRSGRQGNKRLKRYNETCSPGINHQSQETAFDMYKGMEMRTPTAPSLMTLPSSLSRRNSRVSLSPIFDFLHLPRQITHPSIRPSLSPQYVTIHTIPGSRWLEEKSLFEGVGRK